MAPKKQKSPAPAASVTAASSPRKTRSMTSGKRVAPPPSAPPKPKKAKPAALEAKKAKEEPAAAKGRGKAAGGSKAAAGDANDGPVSGKAPPCSTVIVEACKQCTSFKKRAELVKSGVEGALTGITVEINPDKPRRGCFEIRESNGDVFVSLLNMPRPFTPMKKLDMDKVIKDIIKKLG